MIRQIRYRIEAALAWLLLCFFRFMPLDAASAVGGFLGRAIGPHLGATRIARRNLASALPECATEHEAIIRDMWDNLGRNIAEYAHLAGSTILDRVQVEGMEHLDALRAQNIPVFFISGHFGNWELLPTVAMQIGMPLHLIYRPANNPYVDHLIRHLRSPFYAGMYPKGASGALRILRALKRGDPIGLLVDQKMNEGIPVPFFGRDAMTTPAMAQLALKFDIPVLPAYIRRTDGAHFTLTVCPPIHFAKDTSPLDAMTQVNQLLESWIRAYPSQWFWVHNRWPKP